MNNQVIKHLIVMNEFKQLIGEWGYGRGSSLINLPHTRLGLPRKHPKWYFGTGRFKWQLEDYIDRREDRPPFIEPTRPVNPELGKVVYVVKGSHPCKTEINNFDKQQLKDLLLIDSHRYEFSRVWTSNPVGCGVEVLRPSICVMPDGSIYRCKTKRVLKECCKVNGIRGYSKLRRKELIQKLMAI